MPTPAGCGPGQPWRPGTPVPAPVAPDTPSRISTRVRVRPRFEAALAAAREIKAHAPHCRVIFAVYEMKRLGRAAAELTALADHGLVLEMLAGPLARIYDAAGHGRPLFAFFAAMAETERENIRESTLEGLGAAARKGVLTSAGRGGEHPGRGRLLWQARPAPHVKPYSDCEGPSRFGGWIRGGC
ncbi:recombinase family protein [Streptomyces goshikiensis]|uniref:recombinase family protein n=1 Tax=Streptomyces goshikiensis TaxID=1942 RepID=UPI0036CCF519